MAKVIKKPQVSLIVTVLNEADTILSLLNSIAQMSVLPNQLVIVDGGSKDQTVKIIRKFITNQNQFSIQLFQKKSNRSQGRNFAVSKAKHQILAITDAGCVLDPDWLQELLKVYDPTKKPAVAGYYRSEPKTDFEAAATPFFLVMPSQVDPDDFLPATRSMLIEKTLWQELGGLRDDLTASEDYEFAIRLRKLLNSRNQKIGFAQKAVVVWQPPRTLTEFISMVSEQARGDVRGDVVRKKTKIVLARYLLVVTLFLFFLWYFNLRQALFVTLCLCAIYCLWAFIKISAKSKRPILWGVLFQLITDWVQLTEVIRVR